MALENGQKLPVKIVGSSKFGRYEKISEEKTFNMFISDGWLVNTPGFKAVATLGALGTDGEGRGLFTSIRGGFALAVISNNVYRLTEGLASKFVGSLRTSFGEVSIDENLSSQIVIADGRNVYVYNYDLDEFNHQTLTYTPTLGSPTDVLPNYVCYHNTYFLIASDPAATESQKWFAAQMDTPTTLEIVSGNDFALQTKPDFALAVKRLPGRGNNVIVFGSAVAEVWTQVGGEKNYARIQSFNIDQGVVSVDTIAASDHFVCWLGKNQTNAPSIMMTEGSEARRISTDGIDNLLQNIQFPEQSTAFFYRQDGHLFYQLTFFNECDNLSLIYDLNDELFFNVSREEFNYHPARQVIYFNEKVYFVSLDDSNIYEMSTDIIDYNYIVGDDETANVIPRVRITNALRKADAETFRASVFEFWLEQGVNDFAKVDADVETCIGLILTEDGSGFVTDTVDVPLLIDNGFCFINLNRPRVDLSISKNGNQSFGTNVGRLLNPSGVHRNQITWKRIGRANEFTFQLRFWGIQRFVAQDGTLTVF